MLATIPISPSKQGTIFLPVIEKYYLHLEKNEKKL